MEKVFEAVKASPLFRGIDFRDFERMLGCLSARRAGYKKGAAILLSGDAVSFVGLILSGSVKIIKEDADGRAAILAELSAPDIFGEALACAGVSHSPVTVAAACDAEILFIGYDRIVGQCPSACPFHARLTANMLRLIAEKNLLLNQKIEILSKRTIRERLELYFSAMRGEEAAFTVPFNREEMARYLCVDRSAMSNELCKMRDEGIIGFRKNSFEMVGGRATTNA